MTRTGIPERKPMLVSEATALGMAIQEMEAPAAKERQEATRFGGVPGNTTVEPDCTRHVPARVSRRSAVHARPVRPRPR